MPRIFISYRRGDSAGHTGRLYDRLIDHFGQGQVFMDIDVIKPGVNFVETVQQAIGVCDGLVAVIGSDWLQVSDATGARRLDDPTDLVRLEIATALERGIPVIPVLVQGARMPRGTDLPDGLKELANRNALELSDARFRADVEQLIEALEAPTVERLFDSGFVEPAKLESSTFVGRDREMVELSTALEATLAGHGRLVMLVGEPGIGKTRIAQELAVLAEHRGALVLWGRCYEEEGAPPYWPWVQILRAYVQQLAPESLASQLGPGAAHIAEVIPEVREKLPGVEPPPALEPEQARFRLFDSITTFLKNAAQTQPLMLVLDDLHWADRSSLLLLQFLAREVSTSRLLVVGACRDVELTRHHPLSETLAQLSRESAAGGFRRELLRGLNHEDTEQLIEATAGFRPPRRLVETIHAHTEGNPFFISEVIRLLAERGELSAEEADGPHSIRIPEGVRDVIGQRLNRLSERCNETLTTASIIGRQFDFQVLSRVSGEQSEDELLRVIDEALGAHLIEELPEGIEQYHFSHALIQQTLAEELSASRRVRLHARIAEALEGLYGADAEAHAAELAYHFGEAVRITGPEKLVRYSLLAGERALAAFAHEEAIGHFNKGLELIQQLPESPEKAQQEISLQLPLGVQLMTTKGYGSSEARQAFARAMVLCDQLQETPQIFSALWGLARNSLIGSRIQESYELGEQLLDIAQRLGESERLLEAHFALSGSTFWLGNMNRARFHCEQGLTFYDPESHRKEINRLGQNLGESCLLYLAQALWFLGYPDQGVEKINLAISSAEAFSHPFSIARALHFSTRLHHYRRETEMVQTRGEALLSLADEYGFGLWALSGKIWHGWTLAARGSVEEGIELIQEGISLSWESGHPGKAYNFALLAEAYANGGQIEKGLNALNDAAREVERAGERNWEAEVYRLRGELLLRHGGAESESEACFRQAIDVALRQEAKSLELRAAASLARLWQKQGKDKEARQLLAEIYGWFTEGFDTADLKDAKTLLEELS